MTCNKIAPDGYFEKLAAVVRTTPRLPDQDISQDPPVMPSNGGKTGWPPGLLQDDSKGLSRWLASKPDAREVVRKLASTESMPDYTATTAIRQDGEP